MCGASTLTIRTTILCGFGALTGSIKKRGRFYQPSQRQFRILFRKINRQNTWFLPSHLSWVDFTTEFHVSNSERRGFKTITEIWIILWVPGLARHFDRIFGNSIQSIRSAEIGRMNFNRHWMNSMINIEWAWLWPATQKRFQNTRNSVLSLEWINNIELRDLKLRTFYH